MRDKYDEVSLFLSHGADVDSPVGPKSLFWPGFTPLHLAARFGFFRTLQVLLDNDANYLAVNQEGLTALDLINNTWVVDELKIKLYLINLILYNLYKCDDECLNNRGFTFQQLIFSISITPIVDTLHSMIDEYQLDIMKPVPKINTLLDGYTALHFSMEFGHADNSNALIKRGADIFCKAANGDTPVHLALNESRKYGLALDLHGLIGCNQNTFGMAGYSFFHVACAAGHVESMKYYLEMGVDPNLRTKIKGHDFDDKTPLHLIAERYVDSRDEIVKLLVKYGANVNAKDSEMNSPLHCITVNSHPKMIDALISHGADVNAGNISRETPLLSICESFSTIQSQDDIENLNQKFSSFLDHGSDVNLLNELQETPLLMIHVNSLKSSVYKMLTIAIVKHVIRLETINYQLEGNHSFIFPDLVEQATNEASFDKVSYTNECQAEVELMKQIYVNNFTTLYDIMGKDCDQLATISANDTYQQTVNANNFSSKFPIYGPILESRLKKGQARRHLLELSRKALNSLTGFALPSGCSGMIFKFLDNQDLHDIITAHSHSHMSKF
ncbi:hypothetical protein QAD02_004125 [Eretmocerus hayati]|uniref:Uncharacterized protein n=1 Tax=Eretmocerus hayati TaxID=131215 RepID=A0ACC2NNM2_9HYME|nr:hypothetical protein QAD02_004125 [Eretmocerus hayati]